MLTGELTNSTITTPFDKWITSTNTTPFEKWTTSTNTGGVLSWDEINKILPEHYTHVVSGSTLTITNPETIKVKKKGRSIPNIRQVYFNEKTGYTTIVWEDKTSTVVHCGEGETFEPYMGFCAAVVKKLFGSTTAAKKHMDEKDAEQVKTKKEAERQKKAEETRKKEAENRERKIKAEKARVEKLRKFINEVMPLPDVSKLLEGLYEGTEAKE